MLVSAMLTCNGLCEAVSRPTPSILLAGRYQWQIWKVLKCFGFLIYDLVYLIILPEFVFIYDLIYLIILPKCPFIYEEIYLIILPTFFIYL